jgi:hypothetical protein
VKLNSCSNFRFWGHQDHPLQNHLAEKGFYVAHDSQSNYDGTFASVGASLNMEYLPMWSTAIEVNPDLLKFLVARIINNNKVGGFPNFSWI